METPKKSTKFGKGNPGKPKGAVSHLGKSAKEAIALAAERLGGVDRLVEWCQEDAKNEHAFWASVYPKLLPLQIGGEVKISKVVREIVYPAAKNS